MISKYILPFVFIVSFSCNAQTAIKESEEIVNAKWFYYSYAAELDGYDSNGNKIQPLACSIKLNLVNHISADTTNFYFSLYDRDTSNICSLKPLGLVGVTAIRNELYLPIYHMIVFDIEADSVIIKKMKKQSLFLEKKSLESNEEINLWLKEEAMRRKH